MRTLEREIAKVARKSLRQILEGKVEKVELTADNLGDYLGVRRFRYGMGEEEDQIGAVTGLAWTEVGGELLTIEAVTVPGKGQIKTTGKLGEVMQESIQAAMSFVKARAPSYGVKPIDLRAQGHPRPLARRRGAQGRAVGGRRHGHGDDLDPDRHSGAPRRRDDRRGHPARPGAADRRAQGEAARGAARRNHARC